MSTSRAQPRAPHVRFFDVTSEDGTRLRAWTNGADGPDVLLCNGLGTNAFAWPGFLRDGAAARVVSWNHRGTGGSDRPADPDRIDMDAFCEDALAVADATGLERPVLVGWSMGVNLAFELAVRHPSRFRALLAVAGVPGDTFSTMLAPLRVPRPLARAGMAGLARAARRTGAAWNPVTGRIAWAPGAVRVLRHSGFMLPTADPDATRTAVREFLSTDARWYGRLALQAARHTRVPVSQVRIPVTFVAGRWDVLAGARDVREAAGHVPDARLVELRGSHFLPLERPDEIDQELRLLLGRAAQRSPTASADQKASG